MAGALEPAIQARFALACINEAVAVLNAALATWQASGFPRWSDHEVPCTTVVHGCLLDLVERRDPSSPLRLWVEYESPDLSDDQLKGLADPARAGRRDLVLYFGPSRQARFPVECKRLDAGATALQYVAEGIMRFVRSKYDAPLGAAGMVGYVMSRSVSERIADINAAIRAHAELGQDDTLAPASPPPQQFDRHCSAHSRDGEWRVDLTHLFVDMRRGQGCRSGVAGAPSWS